MLPLAFTRFHGAAVFDVALRMAQTCNPQSHTYRSYNRNINKTLLLFQFVLYCPLSDFKRFPHFYKGCRPDLMLAEFEIASLFGLFFVHFVRLDRRTFLVISFFAFCLAKVNHFDWTINGSFLYALFGSLSDLSMRMRQ